MSKVILAVILVYFTLIGGTTGQISTGVVTKSVKNAFCTILYEEYLVEKGDNNGDSDNLTDSDNDTYGVEDTEVDSDTYSLDDTETDSGTYSIDDTEAIDDYKIIPDTTEIVW